MDLPKRKEIRIMGYDYSDDGDYFVTICTEGRANILGEQEISTYGTMKVDMNQVDEEYIAPQIKISNLGLLVEKYINSIGSVKTYVIMPNHIHMIIEIDDNSRQSNGKSQSLASLIRSFKILVTKEAGFKVFQRNYYERIIRNEKELIQIWKYIDKNPFKWDDDLYYNQNEQKT